MVPARPSAEWLVSVSCATAGLESRRTLQEGSRAVVLSERMRSCVGGLRGAIKEGFTGMVYNSANNGLTYTTLGLEKDANGKKVYADSGKAVATTVSQ